MNLRTLLVVLFVIAWACITGISWLFVRLSLLELSILSFLIALIFVCLFLVLERMFIRPFRSMVSSMDAFAKSNTPIPLSTFTHSTTEISALATIFSNFTSNVEQVHTKDVEVSRVKSDFISTAAHQFRTPLTGIRWALEALEKENLTEDQKALVKSAVDKSHDLVAIVGTLLDISSIESGKYKYDFKPMNVGELLEEVARNFEPLAQKSGVNLYYEKENIQLPLVRADKERIKWVLNNLVENAIRYTPADGSVRLLAEAVSDKVFIKVRDTGIGILPQDRANIFERFYRAGNAIAKENQGNGLGLYIARTIATDHGGELDFEQNTEGAGTTFNLSLPIAR